MTIIVNSKRVIVWSLGTTVSIKYKLAEHLYKNASFSGADILAKVILG